MVGASRAALLDHNVVWHVEQNALIDLVNDAPMRRFIARGVCPVVRFRQPIALTHALGAFTSWPHDQSMIKA
jgi:hypothetical protein